MEQSVRLCFFVDGSRLSATATTAATATAIIVWTIWCKQHNECFWRTVVRSIAATTTTANDLRDSVVWIWHFLWKQWWRDAVFFPSSCCQCCKFCRIWSSLWQHTESIVGYSSVAVTRHALVVLPVCGIRAVDSVWRSSNRCCLFFAFSRVWIICWCPSTFGIWECFDVWGNARWIWLGVTN